MLTSVHFYPLAKQPLVGQDLLIIGASRSNSDTPRSVRLLWTSDQLDAEISSWKTHNTHKRQAPMPPSGVRTRNANKRAAADLRLRPRGQWDRPISVHYSYHYGLTFSLSGSTVNCSAVARVHRSSINLGSASKFQARERRHEVIWGPENSRRLRTKFVSLRWPGAWDLCNPDAT
jgi:hypothetical protein